MKRKEEANRLIAQAVQKQQAQDEARKRKAATALSASPPPPPQKIIALQPVVVPMATSSPQNTMPVAVQGELITGIPIVILSYIFFRCLAGPVAAALRVDRWRVKGCNLVSYVPLPHLNTTFHEICLPKVKFSCRPKQMRRLDSPERNQIELDYSTIKLKQ